MRKTPTKPLLLAIICFAMIPAEVDAQSAIAGQVTDSTGVGLPGVMVDAAGAVLANDARAVMTDEEGWYEITGLSADVYTVTLSLPGFGTLVQRGIGVEANCRVPVDVQLRVRSLYEGLTVTGIPSDTVRPVPATHEALHILRNDPAHRPRSTVGTKERGVDRVPAPDPARD